MGVVVVRIGRVRMGVVVVVVLAEAGRLVLVPAVGVEVLVVVVALVPVIHVGFFGWIVHLLGEVRGGGRGGLVTSQRGWGEGPAGRQDGGGSQPGEQSPTHHANPSTRRAQRCAHGHTLHANGIHTPILCIIPGMRIPTLVMVSLLACACGGKKDDGKGTKPTETVTNPEEEAAAREMAPKPIGLESIAAFNYLYGKGEKDYDKVETLLKAKPVDWAAIQAACEATLLKDPGHLDAHRMLGSALARQGKVDGVGEHLSIALAGDWARWGTNLEKDTDLTDYLAGPRGAKLKELNARYRDEWVRRVKKGLLLVGRRAAYKPPSKPGVQSMSTRAELFAYDPTDAKPTFVRVTVTDWRLAGWLMAPSGDEIAYVMFSKMHSTATPPPPKGATAAGAAPQPAPPPPDDDAPKRPQHLAEVRVGVIRLLDLAAPKKDAKFKDVDEVTLRYEPGDKLLVETAMLTDTWDATKMKTWLVDTTTGETKATTHPSGEGPTTTVNYDSTVASHPGDAPGVEADWQSVWEMAGVFKLSATQKNVTLPKGESALRASFAWTPSQARVAFATYANRCEKDATKRQSALYVVDAATGKLKFLFKGDGVGRALWASDDLLVYEDDKNGLRVYDAAQGKETARLTTRGGLTFDGLGATPGFLCKWGYQEEPEYYEGDYEGDYEGEEGWEDEGELPPEEQPD